MYPLEYALNLKIKIFKQFQFLCAETEQQRFSKAIQNGVEANCISSLDVVDYFDDREMLTVVYDLLRRFYEVERYMMRTPKTGTNLATSQS